CRRCPPTESLVAASVAPLCPLAFGASPQLRRQTLGRRTTVGIPNLSSCKHGSVYSSHVKIKREPTRLEKKAKRGHRGYPVATVAYYGPDASRASKVAVGIIAEENGTATYLERWLSEE